MQLPVCYQRRTPVGVRRHRAKLLQVRDFHSPTPEEVPYWFLAQGRGQPSGTASRHAPLYGLDPDPDGRRRTVIAFDAPEGVEGRIL